MRVTKHYEHDHVMLYVEEGDTKTCITLESDRQMQRLGECLLDPSVTKLTEDVVGQLIDKDNRLVEVHLSVPDKREAA